MTVEHMGHCETFKKAAQIAKAKTIYVFIKYLTKS